MSRSDLFETDSYLLPSKIKGIAAFKKWTTEGGKAQQKARIFKNPRNGSICIKIQPVEPSNVTLKEAISFNKRFKTRKLYAIHKTNSIPTTYSIGFCKGITMDYINQKIDEAIKEMQCHKGYTSEDDEDDELHDNGQENEKYEQEIRQEVAHAQAKKNNDDEDYEVKADEDEDEVKADEDESDGEVERPGDEDDIDELIKLIPD